MSENDKSVSKQQQRDWGTTLSVAVCCFGGTLTCRTCASDEKSQAGGETDRLRKRGCWALSSRPLTLLIFVVPLVIIGFLALFFVDSSEINSLQAWPYFVAVWAAMAFWYVVASMEIDYMRTKGHSAFEGGWQIAWLTFGLVGTILYVIQHDTSDLNNDYRTSAMWLMTSGAIGMLLLTCVSTRFHPEMQSWEDSKHKGGGGGDEAQGQVNGEGGRCGRMNEWCMPTRPLSEGCFETRMPFLWMLVVFGFIVQLVLWTMIETNNTLADVGTDRILIPSYFSVGALFLFSVTWWSISSRNSTGSSPMAAFLMTLGSGAALAGLIFIGVAYDRNEDSRAITASQAFVVVGGGFYAIGVLVNPFLFGPLPVMSMKASEAAPLFALKVRSGQDSVA